MAKSTYVKAATSVDIDIAWDKISAMSPEQICDAIHWYAYARRQCDDAADMLDIDHEIFIGVVAAISPGKRWTVNVFDAIAVVVQWQSGGYWKDTHLSSVGYSWNGLRQAWAILETQDTRWLSGPKVVPFSKCLKNWLVDCDVPIDNHMANLPTDEPIGSAPTMAPGYRAKCDDVVTGIAHTLGITRAQGQSLGWEAQRLHKATT